MPARRPADRSDGDISERHWRAMGSDVHVVLVGADAALAAAAARRLDDLEARWTRFHPDSELSRLNRAGGAPVVVSDDTFLLVARAVAAWSRTGGLFDPTLLDAVVALGYDRSYAEIVARPDRGLADPPPETSASRGCADVMLDDGSRTVRLPASVRLDAGGIGKGLAADLVSAELIERGARGALVNVGGDLRARGDPPTDAGWVIGVDDPTDERAETWRFSLDDGGVATSSRARRTWTAGGEARHHLLDPTTRRPADSGVVAATAVSGEAWWSEALATAAVVAGPDAAVTLLEGGADAGLIVVDDGTTLRTGAASQTGAQTTE